MNLPLYWKSFELDSSSTLKLAGGLWLVYLLILAVLESSLTRTPPIWRWYYVMHGLNAILFWGYVSWPRLRSTLGRWFMPIAILLLSLLPILIDYFMVELLPRTPFSLPEDMATRLLPVLFFGLVLTAWMYSWRAVVAYSVGTAIISISFSIIYQFTEQVPDHFLATTLLLYSIRTVTFLLVGSLMNFMVAQQKRQQAALTVANAKLTNYAATVECLAESRERNRVARELHDTLAHTLSGLTVQLETVGAYWEPNPETAHRMLGKALNTSRSGLVETRRAIKALRASPVDDMGLILALRRLGEQMAIRSSFTINLHLPSVLPDLSPDVEQCIYRTAQEALANVARHAAAEQVDLILTHSVNGLTLLVQDDGRGFNAVQRQNGEHFGLIGMQERALLVNGELTIQSAPGEGTRVLLLIQEEELNRVYAK